MNIGPCWLHSYTVRFNSLWTWPPANTAVSSRLSHSKQACGRIQQCYLQQTLMLNYYLTKPRQQLASQRDRHLQFMSYLQNAGAVVEASGGEDATPRPSWVLITSLLDFIFFVITFLSYLILLLGYIPQTECNALTVSPATCKREGALIQCYVQTTKIL